MKNVTSLPDSNDAEVIRAITEYKNESEAACTTRMKLNLDNFDTYHLRQNFSHKKKGQSKEFLAKQFMAVEQITSFVQQGLSDLGNEWYSLEVSDGVENPRINQQDVKLLLDRQLNKADFYTVIGDGLKTGLLGSLMIYKVDGEWVPKPKYISTKVRLDDGTDEARLLKTTDKAWQLKIRVVSPKDFRPDPSGRGLYILEDIELDIHELRKLVRSKDNPNGIYEADVVEMLVGDMANLEKDVRAARESGQDVPVHSFRSRVTITECWGTILDSKGNVLHENVVCAVANNKWLIRKPQKYPFWHGSHPYVVTPIVRVPHSVWHKALMDAPTKHNLALNEIYNLMLDSGIMATYGVKQLRTDWLQDATQVDDGIYPGQTLEVNSNCPPGQKVLERVDTAGMSPEATQVYNLTNAEFQQSAMTNDLRLGVLPSRQVKATEIVESSQSITGMLNGVSKNIENCGILPILQKAWMTICQHVEDFDSNEVQKLLGPQRAAAIAAMSKSERFADTVNGLTFKVFGITNALNKQKDFRRITSLLQTISSSEVLVETFAQDYSLNKLLTEIIKSLDINTDKLKLDPDEKAQTPQQSPVGAAGAGAGPDLQSQIPQAASNASGPAGGPNGAGGAGGSIPNVHFPPGKATSGIVNGPKQ